MHSLQAGRVDAKARADPFPSLIEKNGRDYCVPLSEKSTMLGVYSVPPSCCSRLGRVRDFGYVEWVTSQADIDALRSPKGWPPVDAIHQASVVVVEGVSAGCDEPHYVWHVRFGIRGTLANSQFRVMRKMPSSVYKSYVDFLAQKESMRGSRLLTKFQASLGNEAALDPVLSGFPLSVQKHSREARLRPLRLIRGTLKALALLVLLRARAARRLYAPGGPGFVEASVSFSNCAQKQLAEKADRARKRRRSEEARVPGDAAAEPIGALSADVCLLGAKRRKQQQHEKASKIVIESSMLGVASPPPTPAPTGQSRPTRHGRFGAPPAVVRLRLRGERPIEFGREETDEDKFAAFLDFKSGFSHIPGLWLNVKHPKQDRYEQWLVDDLMATL